MSDRYGHGVSPNRLTYFDVRLGVWQMRSFSLRPFASASARCTRHFTTHRPARLAGVYLEVCLRRPPLKENPPFFVQRSTTS